ncbi:hypothetical protein L798_13004 [Zootermopsis nevadensis]|uniref:Uncharacterized protein n=1 Tax=Zootermopsis nevadensis TaxID=136037 RepID=A0A067RJ39_ZOONE|nr:hypothetical protein L798_13004 [Zootermopsis nevadensis]
MATPIPAYICWRGNRSYVMIVLRYSFLLYGLMLLVTFGEV